MPHPSQSSRMNVALRRALERGRSAPATSVDSPDDSPDDSPEPAPVGMPAGGQLIDEMLGVAPNNDDDDSDVAGPSSAPPPPPMRRASSARRLAAQEEEEIQKSQTTQERMGVARAISKAEQFDAPSANLDGNLSLVDRWIELARANEREEGQIDELLACIGEMPPSDEPSERAFWVGALINPLPAMGVSLEIRPSLLSATSAEQRVDFALEGILRR